MRVIITQLDVPPPIPAAVATGISAQPGGQSGAVLLTARCNIVTTVASGTAVMLNAGLLGGEQRVINPTTNGLIVYPAPNTAIQGLQPNASTLIPGPGAATFQYDGISTWYVS